MQNRESYRRVLKNEDAVDSLLGNLQAKFFCQNTGSTNKWASEIMGERWQKISSTNVGQSRMKPASTTNSMPPQRRSVPQRATPLLCRTGGFYHTQARGRTE